MVEGGPFELSLILRGRRLDQKKITALLGHTPTRSRVRGESRTTRSAVSFEIKVSAWVLSTEGASPSACVDLLANELGGRIPDLSKLPNVEEAYFDMFIPFERGRSVGSEIRLDWEPAALTELSHARIPLVLTFAVIGL